MDSNLPPTQAASHETPSSAESPWARPHHWFLLRGLAREAGHWGEFAEQMRESFPQGTIHSLELPGAGIFRDLSSPLSISETARFVREQFRKVVALDEAASPDGGDSLRRSLPKRYVLCISLGGMVVLEWLRQFEGEMDGAVLINTSLRGFSPMFRRLLPGALGAFLGAAAAGNLEERERRILALVSNSEERRRAAHPLWTRLGSERPISTRNALRQLLSAALHRPQRPAELPQLLFLNSIGDRLAHFTCSEEIVRRLGGTLRTHEWAGHDLPLDDPSWVIEQIRSWRPSA